MLLSHLAKYRSLLPSLALLFHLIDGVDTGRRGPVSCTAAAQAAAWCEYLAAHARRLYGAVTDAARVAAALLATRLAHGRLASPFTAREVYRQEWTGLTEPRVVQGALECLQELGWIRPEALRAPDGGRPTACRAATGIRAARQTALRRAEDAAVVRAKQSPVRDSGTLLTRAAQASAAERRWWGRQPA